jgi:iron complex outermembrane receptor protein
MASNASGIGATASVRGVAYDVQASGNNGTIEFYLNDAPISAGNLFQAIYDVQQVELLRGPQGTLRGRASPSGSMTVTTHRPDLLEMGGYVSGTATDIGGTNVQGAFGFPLIEDKLAIRIAGLYDENEGNRVKSVNSSIDPKAKTQSGRVAVRFEPTDSLSFQLTYQNTQLDANPFDAVESQQVINPSAPVNPGAPGGTGTLPFIKASQRLSVQDRPRDISQDFENYNLQAQWAFAGQKLNYVGARNEQKLSSRGEQSDFGNFFPSNYAAALQGYAQLSTPNAKTTAHELRLSSEERIAGMFDYIVGAFYQKGEFPTDLKRPTAVLLGAPSPTVGAVIAQTPIARRGGTKEESFFANLTVQLSDADEISGGARYIKYHSDGSLAVSGVLNPFANEDSDFNATIYSASIRHKFTEDLTVYASTGTSWRPGISATGDFSLDQTARERSFLVLEPEESTSYEIGLKAAAFDRRLRYSIAAFHQKFDNYPYRSPSGVYFVDTTSLGPPKAERVNVFNFVGAVPVEVNGAEAEVNLAPNSQWDIGAVASYSLGKIKDGFVPCNDYAPTDGVPDGGVPASVAAIGAATGGDNLAGCRVTQRASLAPLWSASLQSEYRLPITSELDGFASGQLSLYGDSKNDPTNPVDDYDSYALLNLYLGVRGGSGAWEVSLYAKNVTDTERVLSRSSSVLTTSYNVGATGQTGLTNYYGGSAVAGLTLTPPREFGVTVRYAFGAK